MTSAIVPRAPSALPTVALRERLHRLRDDFFRGKSPDTIKGYKQDLDHFLAYAGVESIEELAHLLVDQGPGATNDMVLGFRNQMTDDGAAPATINRRLAAIRSLVSLMQLTGLIGWSVGVKGVKGQRYRDTTGPGVERIKQLLAVAQAQGGVIAARDTAMILLLFVLGMRSIEVRELDAEHVDFARGKVWVRGKGKQQRVPLTLPEPVKAALHAWMTVRRCGPGPLFVSLGHGNAAACKRLSRLSFWRIVSDLGKQAGFVARPHGLRHTAITEALVVTDGNVVKGKAFSRHADMNTMMGYNDQRIDAAGDVAAQLSQLLAKK